MTHNQPQLSVKNLTVSFPSPEGRIDVVKNLSFDLHHERVGIVGESGSGKSMTARAILGLIQSPGYVAADHLNFYDEIKQVKIDLLNQTSHSWRQIRGGQISMIMQDPKYSLNPVMTVFDQICESVILHKIVSKSQRIHYVMDLLTALGIQDPQRIAKSYPHQLSGGIGQRVMIAIMLASQPSILIADEPTSALDSEVKNQILALIDHEVSHRKMGLLIISHDLKMVSQYCDRILIMYKGQLVESLKAEGLFDAKHPYTQGLLNCLPSFKTRHKMLETLDRNQFENV